jgi:hypothetical protein
VKQVVLLPLLSVLRLYSIDDRMINDYGTVGGRRIGKEKQSVFGENLSQCYFVHHKSHMTWN